MGSDLCGSDAVGTSLGVATKRQLESGRLNVVPRTD